jgi:hypothetical protein
MYLGSEAKIVEQPFVLKPGMSSGPADLEGLRRFVVLRMSDSDTGGHYTVIHSDDYSREKFDRPTESTLQRFSYFMRFDDVRAIETTTTTTSTEQSSYRLDHLVGI